MTARLVCVGSAAVWLRLYREQRHTLAHIEHSPGAGYSSKWPASEVEGLASSHEHGPPWRHGGLLTSIASHSEDWASGSWEASPGSLVSEASLASARLASGCEDWSEKRGLEKPQPLPQQVIVT